MAVSPFRVKAVYDYSSPHDDDLSFPNGQIITVTDEEDADWYFGEYTDTNGAKQKGLFPRNFVERYEPETPPRPSRSNRARKEPEAPPPQAEPAELEAPEQDEPEHELEAQPATHAVSQPKDEPQSRESSVRRTESIASRAKEGVANTNFDPKPQQSLPSRQQSQASTLKPPAPGSSNTPSRNASGPTAGPSAQKSAPPPVVEKPTRGSFKDRIAAFNKPAGPVAPAKPAGLGQPAGAGFVKKPFVAPPPSKNAYVPPPREPPPQKVYRREEEPDALTASSSQPISETVSASTEQRDPEEEDQPKPTSLKERIALLQKQQMEQAARQASGGHKKEKPKKPPKKRTESDHALDAPVEGVEQPRPSRESNDVSRDAAIMDEEVSVTRGKDKDLAKVPSIPSHAVSDGNEADQSGAGDTEEGDVSTGYDDPDERSVRRAPTMDQGTRLFGPPPPTMPMKQESLGRDAQGVEAQEHRAADDDNDDAEDEDEEDEDEEEVDPEVRRRQEIRERMAKMSGGMGMAGMFGAPMGFSPMASKGGKMAPKQTNAAERDPDHGESMAPRMLPIPGMALPGMQRPREPRTEEVQVAKETEEPASSISAQREPEEVPDVEDVGEERSAKPQKGMNDANVSSPSQDQPSSAPPPPMRSAGRPVPGNRPPPDVPSSSRPAPSLPPQQPMTPTAGSDSDDELSDPRQSSQAAHQTESQNLGRAPPPPPSAPRAVPNVPSRPPNVRTPDSQQSYRSSVSMASPKSPKSATSATFAPNRSSRVPPIPSTTADTIGGHQGPPSGPPAPPAQPPIPRRPTGDGSGYAPRNKRLQDSEEEVTGYDGDYDTDIASGSAHRNALTSHGGDAGMEEPLTGDESSYHHLGLPSLGPAPVPVPSAPPRAVPPPPPPNQPSKLNRRSSDMPRAAPPPPPPAPPKQPIEADDEDDDNDEDDFVPPPPRPMPTIPIGRSEAPPQSRLAEEPLEYESPQSSHAYRSAPAEDPPMPYEHSSRLPPPDRPMPRQSFDTAPNNPRAPPPDRPMPRQSLDAAQPTNLRRSLDAARPTGDGCCIAGDIDIGRASQWWIQRKMPPPIFQNRIDVLYEMEEISSNQTGSSVMVKEVYALFMDYSQSVVTARFDTKDPTRADLQQRHEPAPARLRQDQLEAAHHNYGARIAQAANAKLHATVGDGSAPALIHDLLAALPEALPPVGQRSYGALVYANLANATVTQNDEIRAGDVVSFRNAKLQGHKGPVKQKYGVEVGKPDHVGVVVDWDGTKKKIRAWEQGREGRKVKVESFKLGDLRSGEVKVWRVMPRSWVGWGAPS